MADQFADAGYLVIVPDFYAGDDVDKHGGFGTPEVCACLHLCCAGIPHRSKQPAEFPTCLRGAHAGHRVPEGVRLA